MKKILLLFYLLLITSICCAQHLKFMGIPIDGSINAFQTKLIRKGFRISDRSKYSPIGVRSFEGYFTNKKVEIVVFYNAKTKDVYQCRVALDNVYKTMSEVQSDFDYYKNLLSRKYDGLTSDMIDDLKEDNRFSIAVVQQPIREGAPLLGFIELSIQELDYGLGYSLWIDYEDTKNSSYNEQQNTNDL